MGHIEDARKPPVSSSHVLSAWTFVWKVHIEGIKGTSNRDVDGKCEEDGRTIALRLK